MPRGRDILVACSIRQIDFAKEAEAAGAYGENVVDPNEIAPALRRGLNSIREGVSAGDLGSASTIPAGGLSGYLGQ